METWFPKPWMLPAMVAAVLLPTFAGFALGGPQIGVAIGGLVVAAVVVVAMRSRHREPIPVGESAGDDPVLVVTIVPIEDPVIANRVAAFAEGADDDDGRRPVLVLAPAKASAVRRWLSDVGPARYEAQRSLALSVGTLATADCEAEGRVIDEDVVQGIADVAAEHGAARIAFVVPDGDTGEEVAELRKRFQRPVERIEAGTPTASV